MGEWTSSGWFFLCSYRLTTDNTALWIQGGEAHFCFPRKGHMTWSTQTRPRRSLASLSKYSNDRDEQATPFWIQQYSSASTGSHRSLFLSCSMWAALVKAGNPGWEESESLVVPTCRLSIRGTLTELTMSQRPWPHAWPWGGPGGRGQLNTAEERQFGKRHI